MGSRAGEWSCSVPSASGRSASEEGSPVLCMGDSAGRPGLRLSLDPSAPATEQAPSSQVRLLFQCWELGAHGPMWPHTPRGQGALQTLWH